MAVRMDKAIKIGVLYSTTGPYGPMGREGRDGAEFAIEELRSAQGVAVEPVFVDPEADINRYLEGARYLLREAGCRHIVGTITSLARKEVIPLVEKHDGLLWYMCPFEGFEANENVIYIGATPRQHLLPLFDYLLPRFGNRPYLVGANYVWGWEMNRLARELILQAGGEVLGERYLPLEETAVQRLVLDIEMRRPSFILNNLIGPSSYAFLRAIDALGQRDPAFLPENCPVVSCDLTECELDELAPYAGEGQLTAAAYFDSLGSGENLSFKARVARHYGAPRLVSSLFASAYAAVKLCVDAIGEAGSDEPARVRQMLVQRAHNTVLGPIVIDRETNHAALPFHLGRIRHGHGFDIIQSQPAVAADPYLTGQRTRQPPKLRVVS